MSNDRRHSQTAVAKQCRSLCQWKVAEWARGVGVVLWCVVLWCGMVVVVCGVVWSGVVLCFTVLCLHAVICCCFVVLVLVVVLALGSSVSCGDGVGGGDVLCHVVLHCLVARGVQSSNF